MLKSINFKLILSIGLITVLIFGIFSYIFITHQNKQLIKEVFRGASIFSDAVKRSTRHDMLMDDREGVHRMIETIGNQSGVEVVRIFNKEGKIMFSTNKGEMNNYVDKNAEACYTCHAVEKPLERLSTLERSRIFQGKSHRILAVITPIYNEPDCYNASCHAHSKEQRVLGVLDIGMSLVDVDNELKTNQVLSISFTLIAILCISSILTLFIHRLVTKPVKQLVTGTQKIAQGNLDIEIPVKAGDEIGQLAVSFNHMIRDLKKANEKIHAWNIELEKKVEERTEKLRRTRHQLIQSEKMASLGVLSSSVAHEINNPLQGILTYIKLMLKILSSEEVDQKRLDKFKNYLQVMGNEIERCGDMVKNLLVFSKQTKLNIQETNINNIIRNSLQLVDNKIKLQNIEVILNLQEDIPLIYCDIKQIQQTLISIIINSLEAMAGGGTLRIDSRSLEDRQVEILIADTGEGIPKENLRNIFDPFFTTKETAKSTGLGLFVAYGIIKEHKGTIKVESEVGKGTTFHIKLPTNQG
ncbi:MAG: HAMP domain-containing protein [Candidatus Aminicenantes bacterium]|nr:HAMP domain-containing protein [Candidatus Aminicenantes bacterium]NIM81473.1 HAMP domain-containing protein [Candidatus Aminicenantes bacterium]NIN20839.1 HAMP domain-containing protein [Candidatus Aminicenantes bacterium]NIN44660.1 HAMP domain-containing protein [Candidatus Aminicenantes bacterium]NIN87469.1 HAMP domain-containing protein [Candidatus Aminicenantes bacterium]